MRTAIIFDMDGVISDTQLIHAKTESDLLKQHGIEISPEEITRRFAGVSNKKMFPEIFSETKKEMPDIEQLVEKKWKMMDASLKDGIAEISGTREFIEKLTRLGIQMAVGSASRLAFIKLVLKELRLQNAFSAIASAEEVKNGKPEPDVFLLAAQRLGVAPKNCVVVEDGINGMIAAKRAGMRCIGLVKDQSERYPADLLVSDLREVPIEEFL